MELSLDKIKLERKLHKLSNRSTLTDHTNSKIGNLHRFLDDLEDRMPSPPSTKDKENCSFLTNSISQQSLLPEEVILSFFLSHSIFPSSPSSVLLHRPSFFALLPSSSFNHLLRNLPPSPVSSLLHHLLLSTLSSSFPIFFRENF